MTQPRRTTGARCGQREVGSKFSIIINFSIEEHGNPALHKGLLSSLL